MVEREKTPRLLQLERDICRALGLNPEKTRAVRLHFGAGEFARVEVYGFLDEDDVHGLVGALEEFTIVPLDEKTGEEV